MLPTNNILFLISTLVHKPSNRGFLLDVGTRKQDQSTPTGVAVCAKIKELGSTTAFNDDTNSFQKFPAIETALAV